MFIAGCLARDSYLLTSHNALDTTAELLGVDGAEAVAWLVAELPAVPPGGENGIKSVRITCPVPSGSACGSGQPPQHAHLQIPDVATH
jgi:hypothetical protein